MKKDTELSGSPYTDEQIEQMTKAHRLLTQVRQNNDRAKLQLATLHPQDAVQEIENTRALLSEAADLLDWALPSLPVGEQQSSAPASSRS